MASIGPNSPSAASEVSTGQSWTGLSNVYASDNTRASCAIVGAANSKSLVTNGYGFSLGSTDTITGIELNIERSYSGVGGGFVDYLIYLTKDGTNTVGSNKSTSAAWASSDTVVTFGGSSDLWGTTWSYSDINASTFGGYIQCRQTATKGSATALVDYVSIKVYYTPGEVATASPLLLAGD